jgi:hypothetical protein
MDANFAKINNIYTVIKETPYALTTVAGRPVIAGQVTSQYIPLRLIIGDHTETIQFDLSKINLYPIILGIDW